MSKEQEQELMDRFKAAVTVLPEIDRESLVARAEGMAYIRSTIADEGKEVRN